MKVTSIPVPVPADLPVVNVELTRTEACDLAGMLLHAIDFEKAPLALALFEALTKDVDESSFRNYSRPDGKSYFEPDDA